MIESDKLDTIVNEVSERVQEILSDKLKKIILYGSYARGDYEQYSDIDIMVLADIREDDEDERMDIRNKMVRISSDLGLEYDVLISIIVKNHDFFYSWIDVLPFYRNVLKDGILLYG